ncbi:MAG: cation:proton antiporter [Dehalococcoidia bacterium]
MTALTTILLNLFIIFVAAKVAAAIATRLGQPSVIGELLAGVVLGPHALGWIGVPSAGILALFHDDAVTAQHALDLVLESFAELGVIVLLFVVGLEVRATDIMRVGGRAVSVGVLGIAAPFILGYALMAATGHTSAESAFVATALVATSVGITARVLQELGVLRTRDARVVLGAAVIDDILALLLLAVVSASAAGGSTGVGPVLLIAVQALAFVGFVVWAGGHATRRLTVHVDRLGPEAPLALSVALMLGLAVASASIGLAAIIGAFLAGMALAETRDRLDLEWHIRPVYEFLTPYFFVVTGSRVDLGAFGDVRVALLAAAITALAIVGKVLGAGGAMWGTGPRSMLIVGVSMTPRGRSA